MLFRLYCAPLLGTGYGKKDNKMNIHDEVRRMLPLIRKEFVAGEMRYIGVYPTKERVRINVDGTVILINAGNIGQYFAKVLAEYNVPFRVDQEKYNHYTSTNLRIAGLID